MLALDRFEHLAGRVESYEFDRNAQPTPEFAGQIRRDTLRLSGCFVRLCEHRIAEINRRTQLAARSEVFQDVSRNTAAGGLRKDRSRPDEKRSGGVQKCMQNISPVSGTSLLRPCDMKRNPVVDLSAGFVWRSASSDSALIFGRHQGDKVKRLPARC
jgi:hypothetical protein